MTTNLLSGGQLVVAALRAHRVDMAFSVAGESYLEVLDALLDAPEIRLVTCRQEGGAAFMAEAYGKLTGRPGVLLVTRGPGACNASIGIHTAFQDSTPMLVLVGQVSRHQIDREAFQEVDFRKMFAPLAKWVAQIEMAERIPELINQGFQVATSGRPGPVLLDVPEDVAHGVHDFAPEAFVIDESTLKAPARRIRPAREDIERAARLIAGAKRPLLLTGGGIHLSEAWEALTRFAEAQSIPVAHTMSGKGGIACANPLNVGLFGRYSRIANELIEAADCLIVAGCKLGEIATKRFVLPPPHIPVIHLDIVAEEIGRCIAAEIALWGDARAGLEDLAATLSDSSKAARATRADYAAEIAPRMKAWEEDAAPRLNSSDRPVHMARLCRELNKTLPPDSILVADGGFAGHWTGLLYDTKIAGRHFIPDRGFASIGYGLPGGMGACFAAPDRSVVAISGDGGFNMMLGELETARRAGLGLTVIVVNNAASGYVKALQHAMMGGRYQSADLVEMNYAAIARAMGCGGIRVEDPESLSDALRRGMEERDRPTVIDVVVTRDPAQMLPAVDNRTVEIKQGDRVA